MRTKTYYVYIMASKSCTLYTGVTNSLERRVVEHRRKLQHGFTARYNSNRLVLYEVFSDVLAEIAREKQIKAWGRMKKIGLIEATNRDWNDLNGGLSLSFFVPFWRDKRSTTTRGKRLPLAGDRFPNSLSIFLDCPGLSLPNLWYANSNGSAL